jgi:hypothetical protein
MLQNRQEDIDKALVMVIMQKDQMRSNYFKKWVCVGFGILIGIILAPITMFIAS